MGVVTGRDQARIALAGVRLLMGGAALVGPQKFVRRLGAEADAHGPAVHISRMFGIRTVLIALDLVSRDEVVRRHALRLALIVHVSDTISAAASGLSKQLPTRPALLATGVSAANVVLAAIASADARKR